VSTFRGLTTIASAVHYTADTESVLTTGRQARHRRRVAASVATAVVVIAVAVVLPLTLVGGTRAARLDTATGHSRLAPLADVAATPQGWSAIAYQNAQVSVPSGWTIDNEGYVCGSKDRAGRVSIGRSVLRRQGPGPGCGSTNSVSLTASTSTPIANGRTETVNGIRVVVGETVTGGRPSYVERGLGLDVSAGGPLALRVIKTFTHSPLSVVGGSSGVTAPDGWRHVTFAGLRFAVPSGWQTQHTSGVSCPGNLEPSVLVLKTVQTAAAPSCGGAPQITAAANAGAAGMVVGAGPDLFDQKPAGQDCRVAIGFSFCIYPPPLIPAGDDTRGLQIMTVTVFVPSNRTDLVEIGLNGSGLTATRIFDSLAPASVS
jgi:hypothetical protein